MLFGKILNYIPREISGKLISIYAMLTEMIKKDELFKTFQTK